MILSAYSASGVKVKLAPITVTEAGSIAEPAYVNGPPLIVTTVVVVALSTTSVPIVLAVLLPSLNETVKLYDPAFTPAETLRVSVTFGNTVVPFAVNVADGAKP